MNTDELVKHLVEEHGVPRETVWLNPTAVHGLIHGGAWNTPVDDAILSEVEGEKETDKDFHLYDVMEYNREWHE